MKEEEGAMRQLINKLHHEGKNTVSIKHRKEFTMQE
jgi:hypothetical protein